MTGYIKENKMKSLSWAFGIVVSLFTIFHFLGPIDFIAARVYENKKPVMMEALDNAIEVQELRLEPRLQAIETEQKHSRSRDIEMMEIQREILTEVKK